MRYGITVNDGQVLAGSTEEIESVIVGILLAAGVTTKEPSLREMAKGMLHLADMLPDGQVQGMKLEAIGDMLLWRERGRRTPGRAYYVKTGDLGPAFRATDAGSLVSYLTGILIGSEGIGLERSAALAEGVAHCLSEGGHYPDRIITELKDGSDLLAWWEDET